MNQIPPRLRSVIARLKLETDDATEPPTDSGISDATLLDRTAVPFVTIDNDDSRDLDQALHVEQTTGGWRVRYAIADASFFVRPDTALFDHALRRGASYYFPGFALPMLPRELSEGIVSLNEGVDRRAIVFDSTLDEAGDVLETVVERALIRSRKKLSYNGVQTWFDDGCPPGDPWAPSLLALRAVGELRSQRARERGVIEYDRTEAHIRYDEATSRFRVTPRVRNDVEAWNEQLSLLCNTEGARLLHDADARLDDLQSVYRVHLPPLQSRLTQLRDEVASLCDRHGLPSAWRWDGQTRLADYLGELPAEPWRVRRAIELQVRYTNRASEYSDRVGPHFALAVEQYARFSAPMREIVGVFTHKEALEALGMSDVGGADDEDLRDRVIKAANDSKATQKRIDKEIMLLAISDFLAEDLETPRHDRPRRTGTVIGLRPSRAYVMLDDVPLDLKIYADDLEASYDCQYDLHGHELRGDATAPTFGLGDSVALVVDRYDEERRRYVFDVRSDPS